MAFSWSSATWASLDLVIGVKSSVLVWSSAIGFVIPITYNYTLSILVTLINKLFTTLQAKDGLIAETHTTTTSPNKTKKTHHKLENYKTEHTITHVCNIILTYSLILVELHLSTSGVISKKRIVLQVHLYKLPQKHFGFKTNICKRTIESCCETTFWVLKMHF